MIGSMSQLSSWIRLGFSVVSRRQFGMTAVGLQQSQQKLSDPIQALFAEKIREYGKKQKAGGGLFAEPTPQFEKEFKDELDRVGRVYQIKGDPQKFPDFKFEEPKLDPVSVDFGVPKVLQGPTMEMLNKGWYSEVSPPGTNSESHGWPGQAFSLEVEEILHKEKTEFQEIVVFKSKTYGTVMVLDGVIQVTERDEFAYQEMITHLPLFSHPNPKKVLVIGGGDGGVVREALKHPSVESVVLCEIDRRVIELCQQYLPVMSEKLTDPRVTLNVGDGFEFLRQHKNQFDVIITDSSDPIGPAESLFRQPFYELIDEALRQDGILCCQAESIWLHLDFITQLVSCCKRIFPVVNYAYNSVPTYPSGTIGYLVCSKQKTANLRVPVRRLTQTDVEEKKLRFYNSDVHSAAFVLPEFAKRALQQ